MPICKQLEYEELLSYKEDSSFQDKTQQFLKLTKFLDLKFEGKNVEEKLKIPDPKKLWPIINFSFRNKHVLDATFELLVFVLDLQCEEDTKVKIRKI